MRLLSLVEGDLEQGFVQTFYVPDDDWCPDPAWPAIDFSAFIDATGPLEEKIATLAGAAGSAGIVFSAPIVNFGRGSDEPGPG